MNAQREIELKQIIRECGEVTITVAPHNRKSDSEAYDLKFDNFDVAKNEILILENENTVYF